MDKKICAFTQTYGVDRLELFDYLKNDKLSIEFRNKFDLNVLSFHNSTPEYINKTKETDYLKSIKNLEIWERNGMEYTPSIKVSLYEMLDRGYDYIFFSQDDVLSYGVHYNLTDLFDFVKTNDFKMLYLEATGKDLENESIYYEKNNLKIYNTTTEDFLKRDGWAMDDGSFIANIQHLLDNVYTEDYFSAGSVHNGEGYLNRTFTNQKIERLTTNLRLFKRYNILGPNSHWNGENDRKMLKQLFS